MYFLFFLLLLLHLYWSCDHLTYIYIFWYIYIYIYILMYVYSSISSCVVSLLFLCTCFLLFACNLLFMFHIKMPWWVLFKVFQKYRLSKSFLPWTLFLQSFSRVCVRINFIVFYKWVWVEWFMTSLICSFVCCGFVIDKNVLTPRDELTN